LPGGVVISRDKRRSDDPSNSDPKNPRNGPTSPSRTPGPSGNPDPSGRSTSNDSVNAELDMLYRIADDYLNDLADKSGGRLQRADTLSSLPLAFKQIAAELRTQYSLGYYPPKPERDGKYRKIKVVTTRKGAVVRARPGYRTPSAGKK
jgi:VWFA-related protein